MDISPAATSTIARLSCPTSAVPPGHEGSFAHFHAALISLDSWVLPPRRDRYHKPLPGTFPCSDLRHLGAPTFVWSALRYVAWGYATLLRQRCAMHFFAIQCYATRCFCHAVLRHAVLSLLVLRHSSSPCSAAFGRASFGSLLCFCSASWIPRNSVMPCHATPCHGFFPALCSDRRHWGVLGSFELLGFLGFLGCHVMQCHAMLLRLVCILPIFGSLLWLASLRRLTVLLDSWVPRNSFLPVVPCHATCHASLLAGSLPWVAVPAFSDVVDHALRHRLSDPSLLF